MPQTDVSSGAFFRTLTTGGTATFMPEPQSTPPLSSFPTNTNFFQLSRCTFSFFLSTLIGYRDEGNNDAWLMLRCSLTLSSPLLDPSLHHIGIPTLFHQKPLEPGRFQFQLGHSFPCGTLTHSRNAKNWISTIILLLSWFGDGKLLLIFAVLQ